MNFALILKKLDQTETRPQLHQLIKETGFKLIKNKKRNIEIVDYVILKSTRCHSVSSSGEKIKMPGTITSEVGSSLTSWTRYPGEIISLNNFSTKIYLLSQKVIVPVESLIQFVQEHIEKKFTENDIRSFNAVEFYKEQFLNKKERRIKKLNDPYGYQMDELAEQKKLIIPKKGK